MGARAQGDHECKDVAGMAVPGSSGLRSGWYYIRSLLGRRAESDTIEIFRWVVRLGYRRVGQLEFVFEGVPLPDRGTRTGEFGTYFTHRSGDSGHSAEHSADPSATPDEGITANKIFTADTLGAFIPIDPSVEKIAVQITKNEAATTLVRWRMINIVRAGMVFVTSSILIVGSAYSFFLHEMYGVELTPKQNVMLGIIFATTHIGGMLTIWLMKRVQIEDVISA